MTWLLKPELEIQNNNVSTIDKLQKKRELIKTINSYNNRRLIFHLRNYIVRKYNKFKDISDEKPFCYFYYEKSFQIA